MSPGLGRPVADLITLYNQEVRRLANEPCSKQVSDGVYVSNFSQMSLAEYVQARQRFCSNTHAQPCSPCARMLGVARTVCEVGYCRLSKAFHHVSPGVTYSAEHARKKFLQMPLASVQIGKPCTGKSFTVLVESFPGVESSTISRLLNGLVEVSQTHNPRHLEKSCVKMLLSLAHSDRERETLRYAIFKASGVSQTEARRRYGFEGMKELQMSKKQLLMLKKFVSPLKGWQGFRTKLYFKLLEL